MRSYGILLLFAFVVVSMASCNGGGSSPTAPTYPSSKPTGVTVQSGSQSATLSWNAVPGAEGYYIYMSQDGTKFHRVNTKLIYGTNYSVYNLTNGLTYYFGVSAVGTGGWETSISYPGGNPKALPVIPKLPGTSQQPWEGVAPDAPKNLQGIGKDSAVELEWDATTAPDFEYYRIYAADAFSDYGLIQDNWTLLTFRDEDLTNDVRVSYVIKAVDSEGLESDASNVVTLTPRNFPPEAITGLLLYVNPGRILLEWNIPNETDIGKYAIMRVEGKDPVTGALIIARFEIDKPTRTSDNPHVYAGGFITSWVDVARGKVIVQDMAVTVGMKYTYLIAAIDTSDQEGPVIEKTAPVPVF